MLQFRYLVLLLTFFCFSCSKKEKQISAPSIKVSKSEYHNMLYGFWLGECIANWTGLITEMDKIGNIGEFKTGKFYTRNDWGKKDLPNIWNESHVGNPENTIDYVFKDTNEIWGADDDTDIEYIYQYLMYNHNVTILTPEQIRTGWLKHIKVHMFSGMVG